MLDEVGQGDTLPVYLVGTITIVATVSDVARRHYRLYKIREDEKMG